MLALFIELVPSVPMLFHMICFPLGAFAAAIQRYRIFLFVYMIPRVKATLFRATLRIQADR